MENFKNYIEGKEKNKIIEIGNNINNNFWKEFLILLNNSKELSSLLGVSKNQILSWNKKITEALKNYENKQKEVILNKKNKIIKTGSEDIKGSVSPPLDAGVVLS